MSGYDMANAIRRIVIIRVVFLRAVGVPVLVVMRVDLMNESDLLKQRVGGGRQPNTYQQHYRDCFQPLHAHDNTNRQKNDQSERFQCMHAPSSTSN